VSALLPIAPTDEFMRAAQRLGIEFEPGEVERLGLFLALLLDANARMNLTRITEPGEAWMRHVLDSLTLLPYLVQAKAKRVIDVGSGGGAPGIPLAIALPNVRFTLLEATGKKARFLQETVETLGLRKVDIASERAETAAAKGSPRRETCDVAIARALGPMAVLLELTLPFVRVGGLVLAIKGAKAEAEIEEAKHALRLLQGSVVDVRETPTGRVVIVEKFAPSPGRFPRSPGEPKRMPLGSDRR
jgi:16S rRNA (guanine527-N7)-methyltransferase